MKIHKSIQNGTSTVKVCFFLCDANPGWFSSDRDNFWTSDCSHGCLVSDQQIAELGGMQKAEGLLHYAFIFIYHIGIFKFVFCMLSC